MTFRDNIKKAIAALPFIGNETGRLWAGFIATPLGDMLAVSDETSLHMLEFCDLAPLENRLKKLQQQAKARIGIGHSPVLAEVKAQLMAYFSGKFADFSIPCALHGSDFSCEAWRFLANIPVATTRSYADQAKAIGRPTAYRAVARANSQNRIAIIIPCHRVIGANGTLTGYAGGIQRKSWLLAHEKQHFSSISKIRS